MKKIKNLIIAFVLAFITTLTASGCSNKLPEKTLVIGLECGYPPFNWSETTKSQYNIKVKDKKFYCDGYDVQIAKIIAKDLGYDIQIKQYAWEGLIPALKSNQINVVIAGMSNTVERSKQVSFTSNYYISDLVAVVRKSDYQNIETVSINDFSNKTFVSQLGTVTDEVIDQMGGVKHGTPTETFPLAATAVASNVADGLICEYPVALDMTLNDSSLKILRFSDGFVVEDENQLGVAIAVNKKSTSLLEKLNASLSKITKEQQEQIMTDVITRRNGE